MSEFLEERLPIGVRNGAAIMDNNAIPPRDSVWVNERGHQYRVLLITNQASELPKKYPVTVVYVGANDRFWSRPLEYWHRSMKLLTAEESS